MHFLIEIILHGINMLFGDGKQMLFHIDTEFYKQVIIHYTTATESYTTRYLPVTRTVNFTNVCV